MSCANSAVLFDVENNDRKGEQRTSLRLAYWESIVRRDIKQLLLRGHLLRLRRRSGWRGGIVPRAVEDIPQRKEHAIIAGARVEMWRHPRQSHGEQVRESFTHQ